MEIESKIAGLDPNLVASDERPVEALRLPLPGALSGPLYEIQDGKLIRSRCRVGHAYTADSMLDEKSEALENALYVALNTLAESAAMSERLTTRSHNHEHAARRFEERAQDARGANRRRSGGCSRGRGGRRLMNHQRRRIHSDDCALLL